MGGRASGAERFFAERYGSLLILDTQFVVQNLLFTFWFLTFLLLNQTGSKFVISYDYAVKDSFFLDPLYLYYVGYSILERKKKWLRLWGRSSRD